MAEFTLEQQRALAIARARLRLQKESKSAPETTKREVDLAAEERRLRGRLARAERELGTAPEGFAGLIEAPARFLGITPTREKLLAGIQEEAAERLRIIEEERQYMQRTGKRAEAPTLGQRVTGALASIPRGAIEGVFQAPGTLGIGGKKGEELAKRSEATGKRLIEGLGLEQAETARFDPLQRRLETYGGGLGSILPYVGAEVAGQRLAPVTKVAPYISRGAQAVLGSGQGATQARQQMEEFEAETGQKVDPTTRQLVQAGGGVIGLTELLPIGRMVETLPAPARKAVTSRISNIIARTGAGELAPEAARTAIREAVQGIESRALGRIATRGFAPEALQEGGTQFAQNLLAQQAYNPEQSLMEGVAESALLGGAVGATVRGGVELTSALGRRAAENRKKAFEQIAEAGEPIEEFDINVRSYEDPSQLTRQRVQRVSEPNEAGDVLARRPDGSIYQISLKELYRMRAPTEGLRAVPIPETLSGPAITQRLASALGNVEPDNDVQSYIKSVTTTLNNNMALGTPEKTDTYIQKQQNSLRRSRLPEEARIARMLVLDEAAKLNNEYVDLVTAPPPGAAPSAAEPVSAEPSAPPSDEAIQNQIDTMREMRERRAAAFEAIASDPNYVDKVETFEALMAQNGFDAPSPVEVASLYDAMRAESDAETAAGIEKDTSQRQQLVDRANIIERVLYDDRIPPQKKAERISVKLRNKGYKPLYRREVERIAGFQAANAVYGPEGEYTQRRQALMDQVLADPTITDKYRGFTELLDQYPELGDPTVEETRMLRGGTAELEAQIAPSDRRVDTAQLPAEPGGLPAEIIDRGAVAEPEVAEPEAVVEPEMAAPEMAAPEMVTPKVQPTPTVAETATVEEAAPEPEVYIDNPGGEWLARKQERAEREQAEALEQGETIGSAARMLVGPSTQTIRRVEIPVEKLRTLEGVRGEQPAPGQPKYDALRKSVDEKGFDRKEAGLPMVFVNHNGEAFLYEGNNRVAVAAEEGIKSLPVEVQYINGAEAAPGPFAPDQILAEHRALTSSQVAPTPEAAAPLGAPPVPPAPPATKQAVINPEEDVVPAEEQLQADPTTVEGAFPASLNRPRAEAIGFAADMERRVKSMSSRFIRKANYKYQTAVDYSQALAASYGLTQLPPNLNVARKFELLESRKIGGQMRLNRWYLQPIEDKIKELGLDPKDVGMYLWARSAPARNALVRERNGEENGSGMSDAQAQAKLDQFETEGLGPALREVAKMHDALVDYIGNQRVKAGLLSRADWKAMRKAQPFYTPLKGYALNGDMQVDGEPNPHSAEERGIAESNGTRIREVLTARGRESMPFNPLFNLMSDAQFAIARIEQNKVKEAFLNNVLSDPKSHEGLVTVYTPKKETHPSGLVTMPKIGPNGPVNMNQIAAQKNSDLMIVKKDGKPYFLQFARTPAGNALYRAFANMTPPELSKFMRRATEVSNTIKSFKTRYNPVYIGSTAWMRDFNEAILTAYTAQGIKGGPAAGKKLGKRTAKYIASLSGMRTISNYLKGTDPTTAEDEVLTLLFDQFLEDGGAVGHAQILDAETYAQDTAKSIERYAAAKRGNPTAAALMAKDMTANALDTASQLIDLQARFATYRAALEEGIDREDAAALALDSSLNMTRRGELAPYLDVMAFFYSPTAEGLRKLLSQGRYSTIARKLFTKVVIGGALLYLFNRFGPGAGDDDEDGRPNILDVGNVTAQTRVILRYGSGVNDYVAIPVAFSMGFFNYAGGQIMAAILGDISPEEAGVNIVGGFTDMASPIKTEGTEGLTSIVNFIVPDPAQPVWDLIVNRNAFGSPIYKAQGYSTTPKSELGREETGEGWKFIAQGIHALTGGNTSVEKWGSMQPEQYRYIVEQLLGGAYGVGRDTVNLAIGEAKPGQTTLQRLPIIKTFFGKGGEYAPMNNFYEDYDDLNAIYATYKKSDENPEAWEENEDMYPTQADPRVMEAFGEALSQIRTINKEAREGAYGAPQDKYDALNEVYKDFNRVYNEVKRENRQ